jgi:starch-binding outer membrane protein, SusD/RagB family
MYKKIIFIAIAALSVVGCRKDPTNVAPTDQLDNVTYPKTLTDLKSFLVPGYSNIRAAILYGQRYLPYMLAYDHTFCSTVGGNFFQANSAGGLINNISLTDNENAGIYSFMYQGVADMNVFFNRAQYYQSTYGDSTDVNALRGQAYFLRAYYFMQLECLYGEQYIDMRQPQDPNVLGIPLPTEFATSVAQTNLPRSSAYQVWSQIISDLKLSAKYLHGVTYDANDQGKVTEWAANGLLGKAYVFTKQYDSAKVYLLKVINNGVNSLMPFSQYSNAFNGNTANEFNSESLFEINVDRQEALPGAVFQAYPVNLQSLTTSQGELFAPTIISGQGQDGFGAGANNMGNGYCQYFVHDRSLRRFGFNLPVYTLDSNKTYVHAIPSSAKVPALIMDSASRANSIADRTNNTVDPRLFVCALEPWIDSCEQPYAAGLTGALPTTTPDTIPVGKAYIISGDRAAFWGWSFKKYTTDDNNLAAYGGNDASNLYLLRLADVYLLYAEACEGTGDNATALTYINLVHERAYGGSTAFDYTSVSDATKADPSDVDLANNPLHYERYVELFGEGGWLFDVCRWGIGTNEANYYVYGTADYDPSTSTGPANSIIATANWSTTNSKAYHFPIPNVEMQANPAIQRNNNGY